MMYINVEFNNQLNCIKYNYKLLFFIYILAEKYRHIFSNYTYFNKIQTKAINAIFNTGKYIYTLVLLYITSIVLNVV